jgi:hypothetical protein
MDNETEAAKQQSKLLASAIQYFKKEGYKIDQEKTVIEGFSGVAKHFDLIIQKSRTAQGVWVKEWNRTIGVNVIINLDKASEDVGLGSPVLIGEKFSDHAKSYANRRKMTLLTKRQVTANLR